MNITLPEKIANYIDFIPANESKEFTSLNTSFSNELVDFIDSMPLGLKITHGIVLLISEISTFVCYSGFIHYEYFGGDPAKRSMKNKLIAQLCYSLLVHGMTSTPAYAWRILVGPINKSIAILVLFVRFFIGIYEYLCLTEIVLYRVIMSLSWKSFSLMNEELIFIFLISFNILFSLGAEYSLWMLEHYGSVHYELLTNTFDTKYYEKPAFWPIFIILLGVIMITGMITFLFKKYYDYYKNQNMVQEIHISLEQQNSGPNSPAVNQFNNQAFNESLLNVKETILCVSIASFTMSIFLLIVQMDFDSEFAEHKMVIISEVFCEYFWGFAVPMFFMITKTSVRNFLINEL